MGVSFPLALKYCHRFFSATPVSRYREERIHELESRLARRCGRKPADAGDTAETEPPKKESRDDGNDPGGGSDERDDREEDIGASPADAGTDTDSKLQRLSRQRKEIEAAIAAAMEEKYSQDESPGSDRRAKDPERPNSASRRNTGTREEPSHGRQRRRRRQRQSSGAANFPQEDQYFEPIGGQQQETPTRPIGKPPRAPPPRSAGDRSRQSSGARRTSSVREVDDPPDGSGGDGSCAESFSWGAGDRCSSVPDEDEVRTEESGDGNGGNAGGGADKNWRDGHLSDGEGSVWEEPFDFRGWDENEGREDDPPALMEVGEGHAHGPPKRDDPRRRQRHRVTGRQVKHQQAGTESWRREPVRAPQAMPPRDGSGKKAAGGGVRGQENVAAGDDLDLDDEGSCDSRWSLSAEDEAAPEGNGGATHAQRMVHSSSSRDGATTRGDDAFRERRPASSAETGSPGRGPQTSPAVDPGAVAAVEQHGIDGAGEAGGGVPEYTEDFFDGSEREGRGADVPFAVSPPR